VGRRKGKEGEKEKERRKRAREKALEREEGDLPVVTREGEAMMLHFVFCPLPSPVFGTF
jgi:hypothetical protein